MSEAALDSGIIKMKQGKGKKVVQVTINLTKQDKNYSMHHYSGAWNNY